MKIDLTKKQYETLAKAVYLGNWMVNASRGGRGDEPCIEEYNDISDYIFSLAPEFGFSKHFEHELECGDHKETTEVSRLHEEYDQEIFWDELCDILGERDFYRKYTKEEIKKMNKEEHFIKMMECQIVWEEEAEEHGVERLQVLRQAKDFGIDI